MCRDVYRTCTKMQNKCLCTLRACIRMYDLALLDVVKFKDTDMEGRAGLVTRENFRGGGGHSRLRGEVLGKGS